MCGQYSHDFGITKLPTTDIAVLNYKSKNGTFLASATKPPSTLLTFGCEVRGLKMVPFENEIKVKFDQYNKK